MAIDIKPCKEATRPPVECLSTKYFGYPRWQHGRENPVQGIVIHCLNMGLDKYTDMTCSTDPKPAVENHSSMHYVVSANGVIHQFVNEQDVAWGNDTYQSRFPGNLTPPYSYPGWPILSAANDQIPLDLYVIHIGLAIPESAIPANRKCDEPCEGKPLGLEENGYRNLVRLLAYLSDKYGIPADREYIAFHNEIEDVPEGENECDCQWNACLLCDVSSYCEGCLSYRDTTYQMSGQIKLLYGEDANGCRVKIDVMDLKNLLESV